MCFGQISKSPSEYSPLQPLHLLNQFFAPPSFFLDLNYIEKMLCFVVSIQLKEMSWSQIE